MWQPPAPQIRPALLMESISFFTKYVHALASRLQGLQLPLGAVAGFIILADLPAIPIRTALTDSGALLDSLVICPGLHKQHLASQLNQAEYPAVAALTSGYVFRVENPATVFYLQRISHTGALTNLIVTRHKHITKPTSTLAYLTVPLLTILTLAHLLITVRDPVALTVLTLLILTRLLNTLIITLRATPKWHGQPEPNARGDLLVLLSQDRWVRMRGLVDDLKATTSGQWLRAPTLIESTLQATATLFAYGTAGLAVGMSNAGAAVLLLLLVGSAGLLTVANEATLALSMHACTVHVDPERGVKRYARRLEMVEEMLAEEGRDDKMMRLGLARMGVTVPRKGEGERDARGGDEGGDEGGVVM